MYGIPSFHWKKPALKAILPALLLLLIAGQAMAASPCKKVKGKFTLQPVTGPACISSVGICATGSFTGDFAGSSIFIGSDLIPTADTPTTGVVLVIGDTAFTTPNGTFLTKDAITLATTGNGEFAEVDTIISGTGVWAGYTGKFTATGTFNSATGGAGTYSGLVCAP